MRNFDDDPNYDGVKKVLNNLHKIKAPGNFEKELFNRISKGETERELSFFDKLFMPSRLVPSLGLALTVVLIFLFTNIFISTNGDNPLLVNPRVRTDIISSNLPSTPKKVEKSKNIETKEDVFNLTEKEQLTSNSKTDSNRDPNLGIRVTGRPSAVGGYYNGSVLTSVSPNGAINKRGLDYKQIYLQRLQRAQIEQMKRRIEEILRNSQR